MLLAGKERRLDTQGVTPKRGELAWAPNGKSIAFSAAVGLHYWSLENATVRRITIAPPLSEDWGPILFTRR